jgi:hypothetical protein
MTGTTGLSTNTLLFAHSLLSLYSMPSVHHNISHAIRPLATTELARAFDVPLHISHGVSFISTHDLPFLTAAPSKILFHFGLQALHSPGGLSTLFVPIAKPTLLDDGWAEENSHCAEEISHDGRAALAFAERHQEEKATRADDAVIPVELWDVKLWDQNMHSQDSLKIFRERYDSKSFLRKYGAPKACPLVVLHHWVTGRWQRNLYIDFKTYMIDRHGKDWAHQMNNSFEVEAGRDALHRACRASFWEWKDGSSLFFWRWACTQQRFALEGYPIWRIST